MTSQSGLPLWSLLAELSACRSNGSPEVGRCSAEPSLLSRYTSQDRHFQAAV